MPISFVSLSDYDKENQIQVLVELGATLKKVVLLAELIFAQKVTLFILNLKKIEFDDVNLDPGLKKVVLLKKCSLKAKGWGGGVRP